MSRRLAWAFYATSDVHAVAVLVFVHRLRQLGARPDADIVVLYVSVSPRLIGRMRDLGIVTRRVERLPSAGGYHRDSPVKLRVFQLVEYERVVYLDADAIPVRNPGFLFDVRFDGPIAAPRAYWLPQPYWTSHLMVVKPAADVWDGLQPYFGAAAARGEYDMDIVNEAFGPSIATLPDDVTCLDSEWEERTRPGYFPDPIAAAEKIAVVHFTALGKPWSYSASRLRRERPTAHETFYRLRDQWWRSRQAAFSDSGRLAGLQAALRRRRLPWIARNLDAAFGSQD